MSEDLAGPALLAAAGLIRTYRERGRRLGVGPNRVEALAGVSLQLARGEMLGLVGRSGAGKSTLVRIMADLERPDAGEVRFGGVPVAGMDRVGRRRFRRAVQLVFQDPGTALDPRQTIGSALAEPLSVWRSCPRRERGDRALELLGRVGMGGDRSLLDRLPSELSGGERQRVAIARALACDPEVLLLDEPVAMLDVSVRGQILDVLLDLHERFGLTILLVAHDLDVIRGVCRRVAVMDHGIVVEAGNVDDVLAGDGHEATRQLVRAAGVFSGTR